jgi:RNA polymerase sigma-70 factor (ECF subfamily)
MKNNQVMVNEQSMAKDNLNWKKVYEQSAARIFHYFCYKVGDTSIAEDLTAITFEKAWMNRNTFNKAHGEVHAWIFGIARNVAADYFRRRKVEIPMNDAMVSNGI